MNPTFVNALGSARDFAPTIAALTLAIVGLSLWCVGRKTVRTATCVMGGILGVVMASRLVQHLPAGDMGGVSHGVIGLFVGGGLGVAAAVAFYRIVVAGLGASTFAGAAMLIALVSLGVTLPSALNDADRDISARDASADASASAVEGLTVNELAWHLPPELREKITAALASNKESTFGGDSLPEVMGSLDAWRAHAARRKVAATETWDDLVERDRATVLSAGLVAGLVGLLLGAIAPVRTASFITAMGGGALWMAALGWLVRAHDLPVAGHLDQPAWMLLTVWGAVTLIGVKVQMAGVKRDAHKDGGPARPPQPAPIGAQPVRPI